MIGFDGPGSGGAAAGVAAAGAAQCSRVSTASQPVMQCTACLCRFHTHDCGQRFEKAGVPLELLSSCPRCARVCVCAPHRGRPEPDQATQLHTLREFEPLQCHASIMKANAALRRPYAPSAAQHTCKTSGGANTEHHKRPKPVHENSAHVSYL